MDTYWVKSKKTGEASSQTMLNPFQRQKMSDKLSPKSLKPPVSPTHSRPNSPPPLSPILPTYLSLPMERNGSQMMSPKPDEWPIADHRLSQPPEERHGDRRYTLPAIQCPPIVIQRQLAGPGGGGGLPLADTMSLLDRRNTITTMDPREMQQAVIHSHPPGRPSVSSANSAWPLWNGAPPLSPRESVAEPRFTMPSELSEYNLMNVRDSLTQPLPSIVEGGVASPAQLSIFAAMAEETARQARRVADWAAFIAKAKTNSSRNASSDRLSSSDHGSPVDAFIEAQKICPLSQERTKGHAEKEREDSDAVFENLNGVCPVRQKTVEKSDQSQTETETKLHDDAHTTCSIM